MSFLKSLERAVRRIALRLVTLRVRRRAPGEISLPDNPQIVLVRTDRIGDAVISTPTITLLRQRHPDARITMLFGAKNAAVAGLIPDIDERMVLPVSVGGVLTVLRQLRARRCDLAINLLAGGSATAALVTAFIRARWSIGFAGGGQSVLTDVVQVPESAEHMAITTSRLLGPLGVAPIGSPIDNPLRLRTATQTTEQPGGAVLLLPSVGDPARRWPLEKWGALATRLVSEGRLVAALGREGEEEMTAMLAAVGVRVLPPSRSLDDLLSTVRSAGCVIAPDTASVHIAAAGGASIMMLAGEVRPTRFWYPWGVPFRIVRGNGVGVIEVEEVRAALDDLISPPLHTAGR